MKGLFKLHGAIQLAEARRDFARLSEIATERGRADLVEKFSIPEKAGWRKIDKQIAKIRAELGLSVEEFLSLKERLEPLKTPATD